MGRMDESIRVLAESGVAAAVVQAGKAGADDLRSRVRDVKYGPASHGQDTIRFKLDWKPHTGVLKGRNADLVLGGGKDADAAIAVRVILDGDSDVPGTQKGPTKGGDWRKFAGLEATADGLSDEERGLLRSIWDSGYHTLERFLMSAGEKRTVERLLKKGLVYRGTADTRQGQRQYTLTPAGERALESEPVAGRLAEATAGGFPDAEDRRRYPSLFPAQAIAPEVQQVAEGTPAKPVEVRVRMVEERDWFCPHCSTLIGEKAIYSPDKGSTFQHRACGGQIILPKLER